MNCEPVTDGQRTWPKLDKCPMCARQYSKAERDWHGCDEWYCSDLCKGRAEQGQ